MNDFERLKQCYRMANEFIRDEHSGDVSYSHACRATLSISATILACKLFDSGRGDSVEGKPKEAEPTRTDLLELGEELEEGRTIWGEGRTIWGEGRTIWGDSVVGKPKEAEPTRTDLLELGEESDEA